MIAEELPKCDGRVVRVTGEAGEALDWRIYT